MNKMRKLAGKKLLLGIAVFLAGGFVRAQEAKDTLTLTLDKALEIALSENPTIKVADEEISLKEVANKETWQNLLPQVSISGSLDHTIKAAQMNLGGQPLRWDRTIQIRRCRFQLSVCIYLLLPFTKLCQ